MLNHLTAGYPRRRAARTFLGLSTSIVLALACEGQSFAQTPGLYHVNSQASRIEIHLFREGFLGGLGDNHLIVLNRFSGAAESSPGMPWQVHVVGEAGSLEALDPGLSASARREVQKTMLGPTQLDVARFATIEVRSRSMVPDEANKSWRMLADVTLHAVTRQVEFPLAWTESGVQLRVRGKKELLLRDFNIEPIRKALGMVRVANQFELVYDITLESQR